MTKTRTDKSEIEQTDPEKWDMIISPHRKLFDLRLGEFDVLVGINLLREGLDRPQLDTRTDLPVGLCSVVVCAAAKLLCR